MIEMSTRMGLESETEIRALLVKLTGYRKPIENSTSINLNIKIDGDDAYEFLETVQKRFGTRFETLDWRTYFHNEGEAILPLRLFKLFGYKDKRKSLTFGELLEAVGRGEWFEE